MLSAIEDAVVAKIETDLAAAAGQIEIKRGPEGIPQPAVHVSVEEGNFRKVTSETYAQETIVWVDIVFKHLQDEAQRRKGLYPILEGIVQCLLLQTLGLVIRPLIPVSFMNTTPQEWKEAGFIVFSLKMRTEFNITKISEAATLDLLKVGLAYYLDASETEAVEDTMTRTAGTDFES
jgi:hypothetical protein